jgi:hypothetical protein
MVGIPDLIVNLHQPPCVVQADAAFARAYPNQSGNPANKLPALKPADFPAEQAIEPWA